MKGIEVSSMRRSGVSSMKRLTLLIATLLLPFMFSQAAFAQDSGDLKVGLLLPFTGDYAWVGQNVQPVAQMIVDQVNESGGIGGRQITLVQGDAEGTVDAGFTAAQKLVNVDGVLAVVGPTSLAFSGVQQVLLDSGVPMVTPTAGTTVLNTANDTYFFRTVPSDSLGGRAIARAATDAELLGREEAFKTPVLMVGQAPAMISFRDPIVQAFADYGAPVAGVIEYTPGKPSYRSEVQEALSSNPDLIVLVGTPEDSVRVMQAAFQAGYDGGWFVTQDQTTQEFIDLASAQLVNGIYGLEEVASPESAERNEAFREQYQAYAGKEVQIFGTNTYDAMNVLALAMLQAQLEGGEITRETIAQSIPVVANPDEGDVEVHNYLEGKEALQAGKSINYQGLVGPIDFDDYGNITAPFGIRQVQDGEWVTVSILGADELK